MTWYLYCFTKLIRQFKPVTKTWRMLAEREQWGIAEDQPAAQLPTPKPAAQHPHTTGPALPHGTFFPLPSKFIIYCVLLHFPWLTSDKATLKQWSWNWSYISHRVDQVNCMGAKWCADVLSTSCVRSNRWVSKLTPNFFTVAINLHLTNTASSYHTWHAQIKYDKEWSCDCLPWVR